MRILLISDLPEFLDFFGLRHHYPSVPGGSDDGMNVTRIELPHADDTGIIEGLVASHQGGGPVVAHLSGTTARSALIARELAARNIPFLLSPMLPSYPNRMLEIFGGLPGVRSASLDHLRLAAAIAPAARMILVPDQLSHARFKRVLRMPSGRLHRVEEPGASGTSGISGGAFARPPGASFANLAVTFCDTLTPEWNVLHLLAAMEKINAELVIVAGKTEGPYAEACAEQAATNPRVRFRMYEPGGFTAIAGEVGSLLARASIVVDPSIGGMGGGVVAAAADAGVPSVISRCSARVLPARTGADRVSGYHLARESVFTFEPTSWELLNHAVICAFNAAAGIHAGPASGSASGPAVDLPDHPSRNAAIAGTLRELYRETAARG